MVKNSRAPQGAGRILPVNEPAPLEVEVDGEGRPGVVREEGEAGRRSVAEIRARWRLDDEWWRERPIARLYYELLLEDGSLLTVFRDLFTQQWYRQRYG